MSESADWRKAVRSLDDLTAVEARATLARTPCGDAETVWHIWGDDTHRPVMLLHGGSGSWTHWVRNLGPLVRAGRKVLVPDMPGFGDSAAPPGGHDADVLPGWLERGLNSLIGDTAVDVVGFSFGGFVAGLWAAKCPRRFARLILVGAPGFSSDRLPPLDLRRWELAPAGPERTALHRHNLMQMMLAREESASPLAIELQARNVERDRMRKRRLMMTDMLRPLLPALTCPISAIFGSEDPLYRH